MQPYPATALIILAGGQATRMNGVNKLLQCFDHDIQLLKIYKAFQDKVQEVWINSHCDYANYLAHMRDHHPDHPVLSEAAFHRAAIEARYPGRSGKISKCPC